MAECQTSRSQLQNHDTALCVLKARLYQSMMGRETEQRLTARKQQVIPDTQSHPNALLSPSSQLTSEPFMLLLLQVGTRSQSERIRTYNFSQDRVTDHRTGYVTRDIKVGF